MSFPLWYRVIESERDYILLPGSWADFTAGVDHCVFTVFTWKTWSLNSCFVCLERGGYNWFFGLGFYEPVEKLVAWQKCKGYTFIFFINFSTCSTQSSLFFLISHFLLGLKSHLQSCFFILSLMVFWFIYRHSL